MADNNKKQKNTSTEEPSSQEIGVTQERLQQEHARYIAGTLDCILALSIAAQLARKERAAFYSAAPHGLQASRVTEGKWHAAERDFVDACQLAHPYLAELIEVIRHRILPAPGAAQVTADTSNLGSKFAPSAEENLSPRQQRAAERNQDNAQFISRTLDRLCALSADAELASRERAAFYRDAPRGTIPPRALEGSWLYDEQASREACELAEPYMAELMEEVRRRIPAQPVTAKKPAPGLT